MIFNHKIDLPIVICWHENGNWKKTLIDCIEYRVKKMKTNIIDCSDAKIVVGIRNGDFIKKQIVCSVKITVPVFSNN